MTAGESLLGDGQHDTSRMLVASAVSGAEQDVLAELTAQRDRANQQAERAKQELQFESERRRADVERRNEEIRQLQASAEQIQVQTQRPKGEVVSEEIAQRDNAVASSSLSVIWPTSKQNWLITNCS